MNINNYQEIKVSLQAYLKSLHVRLLHFLLSLTLIALLLLFNGVLYDLITI